MVKHRILLADDSVTIQKVVNLTFADEGIEVVAVGDGDQAMQKFVESVPDLVMVDVNMPGADGYHICEMIKQDDETKHIPVILLVGSFEPFDEDEARRVGADDFLTKPFQSIRQLVNKVTDLLNGKRNASFGEEKNVSSFDDTLEMVKPIDEPQRRKDFGDSTMDDEMIQTSQIGSLPVNEAQKFEFVPKSEDAEENQTSENSENEIEFSDDEPILKTESIENQNEKTEFDPEIIEERADSETEKVEDETNFENEADEISSDENIIKETLTDDNSSSEKLQEKFEAFSEENRNEDEIDTADGDEDEDDELLPRHENIYEFANEQEFEDEQADESLAETKELVIIPSEKNEPEQIDSEKDESLEEKVEDDFSQAEIASEESEPENLIKKLPEVQTDANETPGKYETTQEFALDDFDLLELPQARKAKSAEKEVIKEPVFKGTLSPEDIEAIADRVVEKLSGDVFKEIVREAFLQTTKNE